MGKNFFMGFSIQELLNIFEDNRYQEVVNSIDISDFIALDNPVITRILAASYFKLGDYSKSLTLLSQIESCFIDDIDYLSLYGACLRRCGDLDLARVQFERALKLGPNDYSVQNNFVNLLIDLGDFKLAEEILDKLLSANPDYLDASTNLQRLHEKKRIANVQKQQSKPATLFSLADPLLMAFSTDEVSRPDSNKSMPQNSTEISTTLLRTLPTVKDHQLAKDQLKLAMQAIIDKRYDFALKLCSQINSSLPDSAAIYECVSDAYISKSLFKEAEICLLHSIQLGACSFKLYANLVSLACMRGDHTLAKFYFDKAFAIDPEHNSLQQLKEQVLKCNLKNSSKFFHFELDWPTHVAKD